MVSSEIKISLTGHLPSPGQCRANIWAKQMPLLTEYHCLIA